MKKLFSKTAVFLLAFMMLFAVAYVPFSAEAAVSQSGECTDTIDWKLKDGILTVSGKGEMPMYTHLETGFIINPAPWEEFRDSIEKVVIEDGIESISDSAFAFCQNLKTVEMADSVYSIGSFTFGQCVNLESIKVSKNLDYIGGLAFTYCTSLKMIKLPENIRNFGEGAFYNCKELTIYIPEGSKTEKAAKFNGIKYKKYDPDKPPTVASTILNEVITFITVALIAVVVVIVIIVLIVIKLVKRD